MMISISINLVIMIAFVMLQSYMSKLNDPMTVFGVLLYVLLASWSVMRFYTIGLWLELLTFILFFMVSIVGAYFFSVSSFIGFFSIIATAVVLVGGLYYLSSTEVAFTRKYKIVDKQKAKFWRLILGALFSAPFAGALSFAIPSYYQGVKDADLVIYFLIFLCGISYQISKRIAGVYVRSNPA